MKELANYCIGCKNPFCSAACPLNNDIAGFISLIKEDKLKEAYELLCETTVLQSICGRICPHTKQCQGKCIRGFKDEFGNEYPCVNEEMLERVEAKLITSIIKSFKPD